MKSDEKKSDNIPQFEINDWLFEMVERVYEILKRKDRVIINLAGASASGKGEATEALAQKLRLKGLKVLIISTDDFYIGLAKMIARTLNEELDLPDKVENIIFKMTKDKTSDQKMSEKSVLELSKAISKLNINVKTERLIELIKDSFNQIDFDSPSAVDLQGVAEILHAARNGSRIRIPEYSMKFSERVGEKEYDSSQFNVIIVEGIYGLNERIIDGSDIKSFVETDTKTLLIRRLRRDIIHKRSSFSPAVDLWILLEVVLPAYWRYILPDKRNAELILRNDYTDNETFDTEHFDVQDKIRLKEGELEVIEKKLGEPQKVVFQEDYYFADKNDKSLEHLIRFRVENGRLKDLIHKGTKVRRDDGKLIRPTEEFIKDGEFSLKYSNKEAVISSFKKGGFEVVAEIVKTRRTFRFDDVKVMTDVVEGMGEYLEISTNDKLSKSKEVDKIVRELQLDGRKPIGPYADEYVAKYKNNATDEEQELILNDGLTSEEILSNNLCQRITFNKKIEAAFLEMRRGYPELSFHKQSSGSAFREAARVVLDEVAKEALCGIDKERVVVLMPWKSGVVFAESFKKWGVNKLYHLSQKRDENTLSTIIDYELGRLHRNSVVIVADPMLATGNIIVDAINRVIEKGVQESNILVCSVLAAPVGISRIKSQFPSTKIVVGELDRKLDCRGYIVPGLGDFGDKYFAKIAPAELNSLISQLDLDSVGRTRLIERLSKQGESEVLSELIQRDMQDLETDCANKVMLVNEGLKLKSSIKNLVIDTGRVNNINDVVEAIISEFDHESKIITIEGKSGTGKSSTASELRKKLGCTMLSMGEIFRYLTYHHLCGENNYDDIISKMYYDGSGKNLTLVDRGAKADFKLEMLRSREVERDVSAISAQNQRRVIDFMAKQLSLLKRDHTHRVLVEGRAYTLDFLPSDLRVKLVADPSIRAQRRWNQEYSIFNSLTKEK